MSKHKLILIKDSEETEIEVNFDKDPSAGTTNIEYEGFIYKITSQEAKVTKGSGMGQTWLEASSKFTAHCICTVEEWKDD